ncbi:TetR/AcrR family transcriptional regulator [Saccharopolyspora sp. 5N708]|uniref:TetR/AcrR family transcriptional regulator n=1 Tax=Saccharopolyspora sp. 5N708 TaxID=3457424 RepID=UPI003FD5C6FE
MVQRQHLQRTRQERAADSRTLILEAAVDCLVEFGHAGTSTLAIQAKAGVSRGRLLHHFPSRDGLLVAAAQHLTKNRLAQTEQRVAEQLTDIPEGPGRVNRCIDLLWETFHEPNFWAAMELWTAARTNPALSAALRPEERRLRQAIHSVSDRIWGPVVCGHPVYPELREMLFTSMRGAALVYAFEDGSPARSAHLDVWKSITRRLLFDS